MHPAHFPAKLLLFGEYIIIRGAAALAIPLDQYGGSWQQTEDEQERFSRQQHLEAFGQYLEKSVAEFALLSNFDHAQYQQALTEGWYFNSDIPSGYGLGSSGALCAAVYDQFFNNKNTWASNSGRKELKLLFAKMESFFHDSSSGVDPLICYLQKAVVIKPEQLDIVHLPPMQKAHFFLLDTGHSRSTGPLVQSFLKNCADQNYAYLLDKQLLPANEMAIQARLEGKEVMLWEAFRRISHFQLAHFKEMIPGYLRAAWQQGISGDLYRLKLCGAGGGGFMLGMTWERGRCEESLKEWRLVFL